jgi:hypothetical protein
MEKTELMKEYESQTVIGKLYRNTIHIVGNFNNVGLF